MEKFNNTTLFTGYVKQLLHSFNLPKFRVYTEANRRYFEKYGKEGPDIVETITKNPNGTYPSDMHYVPYIKDNRIQEFVDGKWIKKGTTNQTTGSHYHFYTYGDKVLNYTKNLEINSNIYDSYTHEYLGDYLRFQRDYNNIDLMPLYNCFSDRAADSLDLSFTIKTVANNETVSTIKVDFTSNSLYKVYAIPVKLFKEYTIAIDSEMPVELCCGIYNKRLDNRDKFKTIPALTYQKIKSCMFSQPFVYSKLVNLGVRKNTLTDLAQNEDDLKLFIKLPINNTSTIVVLEGNYLNWNDSIYFKAPVENTTIKISNGERLIPAGEQYSQTIYTPLETGDTNKAWTRITNNAAINFDGISDEVPFNLNTPLQLLRFNTGEQHPFADRLIEYLMGNVITNEDEISSNIKRAQKVMNDNAKFTDVVFEHEGLWSDAMRSLSYDFINRGCANTPTNTFEINHDILGYIDKDVENNYKSVKITRNSKREIVSIKKETILACELEEDK